MIVGTAGHIDHGKTALVGALTGVDTDRLKEEKARGISIELGYAYRALPDGNVLGIIDVPGHERLVHTMVAGACGIDFALLVVAADDGVMPQTREHLAILQLLGVTRGVVALTKADRVAPGRALHVEQEIRALLSGTPLMDARIVQVNATDTNDAGVASLRSYLEHCAVQPIERSHQGFFRLAVDRVFTLKGVGTIATGTVFSGAIHAGEMVQVMPSGKQVRVRSIHAQSQPAERGCAGQRCALNLAAVQPGELKRGDWLAHGHALISSLRMDVRLRPLTTDVGRQLGSKRTAVHVHLGTAHQLAHLLSLESGDSPSDSLRAQLVFDKPACAVPGDHFILRDASAQTTIGGGTVLDPSAPARRRRTPARLQWLDALEAWIASQDLAMLLRGAPNGLALELLEQLCDCPAHSLSWPPSSQIIDAGPKHFAFLRTHWQALLTRAVAVLSEFHMQSPDEPGLDSGRWHRIAVADLPSELWHVVVDQLTANASVRRRGYWFSLPAHTPVLSDADQTLARQLQPMIAAGGFDPPWVRELAAQSGAEEDQVRQVLRKLVVQGTMYQIVPDLFYDRDCMGRLAATAHQMVQDHGAVQASGFRDAVGVGRKRAIQILEFFDRIGYTRRVRDLHTVRPDWSPMNVSW